MRDTLLNKGESPESSDGAVGPSSGVAQATLVCRGWWARLEDVYYAQDNGRLEYTEVRWRIRWVWALRAIG